MYAFHTRFVPKHCHLWKRERSKTKANINLHFIHKIQYLVWHLNESLVLFIRKNSSAMSKRRLHLLWELCNLTNRGNPGVRHQSSIQTGNLKGTRDGTSETFFLKQSTMFGWGSTRACHSSINKVISQGYNFWWPEFTIIIIANPLFLLSWMQTNHISPLFHSTKALFISSEDTKRLDCEKGINLLFLLSRWRTQLNTKDERNSSLFW